MDAKVPGREVAACPGKCKMLRAEFKKKYDEWKVSQGYGHGDFNYLHAWTGHVQNKKADNHCRHPWEDHDAYDGKAEKKKPRKPRKSPDVCPGNCKVSRDAWIENYTKHHLAQGVPLTDIKAGVGWANHVRAAAKGLVCDPNAFGAKPVDSVPKPVAPKPVAEQDLTGVTAVFLKRMDQHVKLLRGNLNTYEKKTKEYDDGMAVCDAEIDAREKKHQADIAALKKKRKDFESLLEESKTKKQKAEETLAKVEGNLADFATNVQTLTSLTT